MFRLESIAQPAGGIKYTRLIRSALERRSWTRLDAAVAYATSSGVDALAGACEAVDAAAWDRLTKRWLISIDYCRTEPRAIRKLLAFPRSEVRIHEGRTVVGRRLCTPVLPFHPKVFLLTGRGARAAVSGSGNLSRNGLTKGHEVGTLVMTANPAAPEDRHAIQLCRDLSSWFARLWRRADNAAGLLSRYRKVYESAEHMRAPTPTDDDTADSEAVKTRTRLRSPLGPAQLRALRACSHLWMGAGNITKNAGEARPGNQLMMSRNTRAYFGFPATDLAPNTEIGHVAITFGGTRRDDCSLVFSDNSMDKLTLPIPGAGGPPSYDGMYLLFEQTGRRAFKLSVAGKQTRSTWRSKSKAIDAYFRMASGGREWGVFP